MPYTEKIRQKAPQMSESFLHIADFLLTSYKDAVFMTASVIGLTLNLDAATVVRFSQFLGYTGYPELNRGIQNRIKLEISQSMNGDGVSGSADGFKSYTYENKIQQKSQQMSKSYALVADFLSDSFIDASFMTANEIAKALNLDPATVVRFSQFLGYSGFPQLQNEIRERAKSMIALHVIDDNITNPTLYTELMAKRAVSDRQKIDETTSMQSVLARQVEAIRAYLQGNSVLQPEDEKLCDWVNFCYTFELYVEGVEIFALVNPQAIHPWFYDRTKKIARLCALRVKNQ